MDIEEAKEQLLKHKKEIDAKFISARYSKAIEVVLSELNKKEKEIAELKQDIKEVIRKDRDCLTFGYHSAYVGLIDDLINIIEEDIKE